MRYIMKKINPIDQLTEDYNNGIKKINDGYQELLFASSKIDEGRKKQKAAMAKIRKGKQEQATAIEKMKKVSQRFHEMDAWKDFDPDK